MAQQQSDDSDSEFDTGLRPPPPPPRSPPDESELRRRPSTPSKSGSRGVRKARVSSGANGDTFGRPSFLVPLALSAPYFAARFGGLADTMSIVVMILLKILPVGALWRAARLAGRRASNGKMSDEYTYFIQGGLMLSLFGDIAMELHSDLGERPAFFLIGLSLFLTAHVSYVRAFLFPWPGFATNSLVFFGSVGLSMFLYMVPGIEAKLVIPVLVYCLVIAMMGWRAAARFGSPDSTTQSQALGIGGAVLFMISDAVIGLNKFRGPVPSAKLIIMSTYYAAQWHLAQTVEGAVTRECEEHYALCERHAEEERARREADHARRAHF